MPLCYGDVLVTPCCGDVLVPPCCGDVLLPLCYGDVLVTPCCGDVGVMLLQEDLFTAAGDDDCEKPQYTFLASRKTTNSIYRKSIGKNTHACGRLIAAVLA